MIAVGGSDEGYESTEIWDTQDNKITNATDGGEFLLSGYPTLIPYGETLLMTNANNPLNETLVYNVDTKEWEKTGDTLSESWKNFIHNGMVTISQTSSQTSESFQQLSCF